MIVRGVKIYKFLKSANKVIGRWLGLVEQRNMYVNVFIKLGEEVSKESTGLSADELRRIGYIEGHKVYPIVEVCVVRESVYVKYSRNVFPVPLSLQEEENSLLQISCR